MADQLPPGLPENLALGILGTLNFGEGRADARFQKQFNDAFTAAGRGSAQPWHDLHERLRAELTRFHAEGRAAFRDVAQASAVLELVFVHLLAAYRAHHRDLLAHQTDADLWQPFFLTRACEAVLTQRGPWDETERIVGGALRQLNDFVGHRPIAVLESRPRGEPYDQERVRPIPLYLAGAGVADGRYRPLVARALETLRATEPDLLADACFDFDLLDELALDPRGYDFSHPAEKRPNYCFGEWDPHHLDGQARFRRYVARQGILDALSLRVETTSEHPQAELLDEAATVLAGTLLMATGVSGAGPQTYDSSTTLSTLVPKIAKYREAFYNHHLRRAAGPHGERLRAEAARLRQAFGGARQHLNATLARERALHLQQRHLAVLLAELGYSAASRRQIAAVNVASARMLTEIHLLLTTGQLRLDRGEAAEAARHLNEAEDLLKRGIECGALVDPWNILAFQGQFPRFQSMEDSVRDQRIDDLTRAVARLFDLYGRLLGEEAARGTSDRLIPGLRRLASWWDRFATTAVSDVPHVHGSEAARSAEFVARTLSRWHERGAAAGDLGFWREQLDDFRSPKDFSLVVVALLERHDLRAAMALLMTYLSQAEQVPLGEGEHSFHDLALRWMLSACETIQENAEAAPATQALIGKFFDYLEANAEEYWQVPRLDVLGVGGDEAGPPEKDDEEDDTFRAAFETMTYQDSTDDDVDAEVLDVMPQKDFDLTHEAERLDKRLRFLATLARLWNIATRCLRAADDETTRRDGWLRQAVRNFHDLLGLLETIHQHDIPKPSSGSYESMIEFDRRNMLKHRLLGLGIATALEQALAVGALSSVGPAGETDGGMRDVPWAAAALDLEVALFARAPARARAVLPEFMRHFREQPLLYTPLEHGGAPREILRATLAQAVLRGLVHNLPRQGLLRETYQLVQLARESEARQPPAGPRITEFDRLFHLGLQACIETLARAAQRDGVAADALVDDLGDFIEPLLQDWIKHIETIPVSALELVRSPQDWQRLIAFIKTYGRELFNPRFLTPANMRAILQRGVRDHLEALATNPDPAAPSRLLDDLGRRLSPLEAEQSLSLIMRALLENFDHFRDFTATVAHSDYGENLAQLLEFLRVKAAYDRTAWRLRPLTLVHEILARHDGQAAALWRGRVEELTRDSAEQHLAALAGVERELGIRLATIRDRLEERFVRSMAVHRLCALVEPALEQARVHLDGEETCLLETELASFAATPAGVGLDVPAWLQQLEGELRRVQTSRSAVGSMAERLLQVPRVDVPYAELIERGDQPPGARDDT